MCTEKSLETLIQQFFVEDHVVEVLNTISDCSISGFEGWLQIEFAHYLQKQFKDKKHTKSWYREYQLVNNVENSEKDKNVIPDFWFSIDEKESEYDLIEFKQNSKCNLKDLETSMQEDCDKYKTLNAKVKCTDQKTYKIRNVYFVGVLPEVTEQKPKPSDDQISSKLNLTELNTPNKFTVYMDCKHIDQIN